MHCPRCGTENEEGDRYCANCGATLRAQAPPQESLSAPQRLQRLIGTSRRARLITVGTIVAIVIAVIAAISLPPNEDEGIPRDSYTISADQICVNAKKQIGAAANRALGESGNAGVKYADALVPIVAQWRVDFNALSEPSDRIPLANQLNAALQTVETDASALVLAAQRNGSDTSAQAQKVDGDTLQVEDAIRALGLDECSQIEIAPGAPAPG